MQDGTPPHSGIDAIDALLERRPWSALRVALLLTCFAVTLMDGAHQLTMAVAAPVVARDAHLAPTGLGLLMAGSELGFMLGALALAPLVDRLGRKPMLLAATLGFGLASIATGFSQSLPTLFATRLFTGIGLGCAGPAVVSLATEYAPIRHRARVATLIWAANPAGAFSGGLLGGWLVPHQGWRALFLLAGGATLVLVVLVALATPESLRFLLLRAPSDARIGRILRRLGAEDPAAILADASLRRRDEKEGGGVPVGILFAGDNRGFTTTLWIVFLLSFMALLASLTWTVSILGFAGVGLAAASAILACNSIGGTVGVATMGWAMEQFGGPQLLLVSYLVGVAAIVLMGQALHAPAALALLSCVIGLAIGGNTAGLIALAVDRYPTTVRATGLGWGLAAGRLGGALGPLLMGAVAATGAAPALLFAAMAVPAALAATFTLPLCRRRRA